MKALGLVFALVILGAGLWYLSHEEGAQAIRDLEPGARTESASEDVRERVEALASESTTPPETSDSKATQEAADRASAANLPSWTLDLVLSGIHIELEKEIELVVYATGTPEVTTTARVSENGTHAIDVSKVARAADENGESHVTVLIDHPQFYIQEEAYVGIREADQVTFRVEIELDPFLSTFRGHVRIPGGADINQVQIGVFSKREFQLDKQPLATTRPKPDGSFSLEVEDPGHCVLLAAQRELRPASQWFEAEAGKSYDEIELRLEPGHRIRGTAYSSGSPAQGGYVNYERLEANFHEVRLGGYVLAEFADRFEFARARKRIRMNGEFELNGLANTIYELRLQTAEELGGGSLVLSGYRVEQEVRAPAEGLVLESSYALREILVLANGVPVNEAFVRIGQNEGQLYVQRRTKEDGRMKLGLIESEPLYAQVFVDGYHPQLQKLELDQIAEGVTTVFDLQRK